MDCAKKNISILQFKVGKVNATYSNNTIHDGIKGLRNKALGGNNIKDILKESAGSRMCVSSRQQEIFLCVQTIKFLFQSLYNLLVSNEF